MKSKKQKILEYDNKYGAIPKDYISRLEWLYDKLNIDDKKSDEILSAREAFIHNTYYKTIKIVFYEIPEYTPRPRARIVNRNGIINAVTGNNSFIQVYSITGRQNREYMQMYTKQNLQELDQLLCTPCDIEYNTYVVRDRAFLRRFDRVDVAEQDIHTTVEVLMKTLPKTEHQTGIKFKYNEYVTRLLIESIVEATSEFKRVYGLGAMYPDICFSVLTSAFSHALYQNKPTVNVEDVYNAIKTSKRIYPDSIIKELTIFREKFKDVCISEGINLPIVTIDEIQTPDMYE